MGKKTQKSLSLVGRKAFPLSNNLNWSLLEIQVSLPVLDAFDAALQLVQELRVDVFEVVLDELPGLGGLLWHSICDLVWQVNPKHLKP